MSFEKYVNLSVGDIVSRGWRLYRLNFKDIIPYVIPASILFTISGILFNFPSSRLALALDQNMQIVSVILALLLGCGFWLLGFFISIGLNLCLVRHLYKLIFNKITSFQENFRYFWSRKTEVLTLGVFTILESSFFYMIDIIMLIVGYIIVVAPMILIAVLTPKGGGDDITKALIMAFSIILMIFLFLCTIFVIASVVAVQFNIVIFQIIYISTDEQEKSSTTISKRIQDTFALMFKTYELIFTYIPRTVMFGLLLWLTAYIVSITVTVPATAYLIFDSFLNGQGPNQGYSFLALTILQLVSTLASTLLWPFIISAFVLLYMDLKINREGFDISYQLKVLSGEVHE